MHLKKLFAAGTTGLLVLLLLTATALAHGGHHRTVRTCQLCTVEGCEIAGRHTHNGVTYCGYDHAAGFCDGTCAALCSVEGCTIAGRHTHSGAAYCGYDHAAGFCDGTCAVYDGAVSTGGHCGHHGRCH